MGGAFLNGDCIVFCRFTQNFTENDVVVAALAQDDAFAKSNISVLPFGNIRQISGETDIDTESDLRIDTETAYGRTAQ